MRYVWRQVRRGAGTIAALAVGAVSLAGGAATAAAQAVITNPGGQVSMGINREGQLGFRFFGLRFNPEDHDGVATGCECEGWGVGVSGGGFGGLTGFASRDNGGVSNLFVQSFTSTATSATSVTTVRDAASTDVLRVTHAFTPGASPYLYRMDVTLENLTAGTLGASADGLRYRRVIDWDGEPTADMEFVTLRGTGAANILRTSNDGFVVPDPFVAPSQADLGDPSMGDAPLRLNQDFVDFGPFDHGALFDLGFAALAPGATRTFTMFWGAAPNEAALLGAFASVGAEAYSTVKCDPGMDIACTPTGEPNTFGVALIDVGGTAVIPEPATVALLATGLGVLGAVARRRRTV